MWLLRKWFRRDEGQDLTEYALIIALIVIAAVVAIRLLGTSISGVLDSISTTLASVLGGGT